jgi:hypothetical protein
MVNQLANNVFRRKFYSHSIVYPVAAPFRERGCCQRVYRPYRHRYRKTHSAAAFDKTASENQFAFSLNDHKPWAFEHDFCGVALFLMFAPGFRDTDTALSTIAAVTSTDRSWPTMAC